VTYGCIVGAGQDLGGCDQAAQTVNGGVGEFEGVQVAGGVVGDGKACQQVVAIIVAFNYSINTAESDQEKYEKTLIHVKRLF